MAKAITLFIACIICVILSVLFAFGTFSLSSAEIETGEKIVQEIFDGNREAYNKLPKDCLIEEDEKDHITFEKKGTLGKVIIEKQTGFLEVDEEIILRLVWIAVLAIFAVISGLCLIWSLKGL